LERYPAISWTSIIDKCRQRKLTVPVRCCLQYLKEHYRTPLPDEILELLFRQVVSPDEHRIFTAYTSPLIFSQRVIRQWGLCRKDFPDRHWIMRTFLFPGYLKQKSGIEKYSDCVIYLFRQLTHTISSFPARQKGEFNPL
jgi:hypothetical protein